jgi:uncharacterized membrane protein YphA (DoxX/SURF4 family)
VTRVQSALLFLIRIIHSPAWIRAAILDLEYVHRVGEAWGVRGFPAPTAFAATDAVIRLIVSVLVLLGVRLQWVAWLGLAVWIADISLFDPDSWLDARPWAPEPLLESARWLPVLVLGVLAAFGAGSLSVDGAITAWREGRMGRMFGRK